MRKFVPKDLEEVNSWMTGMGLTPFKWDEIPNHGFIEEGVACGFLLFTPIRVCFLECFVSKPGVSPFKKYRAFRTIARSLLTMATLLGFTRCIILSKNRSLLRIGKSLGIKQTDLIVSIGNL